MNDFLRKAHPSLGRILWCEATRRHKSAAKVTHQATKEARDEMTGDSDAASAFLQYLQSNPAVRLKLLALMVDAVNSKEEGKRQ